MLLRLGLWPLRLLWALLPIAVGASVIDALDQQSSPVRNTVEIGMWAMWFVGLIATLAPSAAALTVIRILAPAATVSVAATMIVREDATSPLLLFAGGYSVIVAVVAFLPTVGDPLINGSAYGSERRMALRPPAALLLGPIQLAWALVIGGASIGPLLVASGRTIIGIVSCALGLAVVIVGCRALHHLSRRWIVFVPAGFVIHDYMSLAESILIQRRQKPTLGPAERTTEDPEGSLDLSGSALGLALAVEFDEAVPVALKVGRGIESKKARRFVFTPSLPGELLQEARVRAIDIG